MELDDLKARWQKETEIYSELNRKDTKQLQLILKEKSSGVLIRVKKKYEFIISMVLLGIFANVLISPFLHWILGDEGPVFRMPSLLSLLTVIIMCLIILGFYWIKYLSLKTAIPADDLRTTLSENVKSLKRSFKQEVYFLMALFLVLFVVGRATSQFQGNGEFWDIFRADIMLSMLAGSLLTGLAIFRRRKQYQKNIQELEKYLSELNDA